MQLPSRAVNNQRRIAGNRQGQVPRLGELLGALPKGTPLSVELRSKALRDGYADPGDRSRALLEATRRWVDRAFKTPSYGAT